MESNGIYIYIYILVFQEMDELETYPAEIIPGLLYLGNWRQANAPNVQKDLKIQAHINCCEETGSW